MGAPTVLLLLLLLQLLLVLLLLLRLLLLLLGLSLLGGPCYLPSLESQHFLNVFIVSAVIGVVEELHTVCNVWVLQSYRRRVCVCVCVYVCVCLCDPWLLMAALG